MADEKNLLLWGDTRVGKSTLLITALQGDITALPALDRAKSADELRPLAEQMRRLRTNGLMKPTSTYVDYRIATRHGAVVRIRDVKGGFTRSLGDDQHSRVIRSADAVLFVLEWQAADLGNQLNAIESAWDFTNGAHRGLVFTRCEVGLSAQDVAWQGARGWWRASSALLSSSSLIERFGDAVWPTSSFGYELKWGNPAVILGEFGQLLPYRISPRNVHLPFRWALSAMGVT